MSPSEIGFLALGLIIGITAGVTLLAVLRPRSPFRPVVKVTVTPHAMTPRDGIGQPGTRPARLGDIAPGSPDEEAHAVRRERVAVGPAPTGRPSPVSTDDSRTRVPSVPSGAPSGVTARAVAIPVGGLTPPLSSPNASAVAVGGATRTPVTAPSQAGPMPRVSAVEVLSPTSPGASAAPRLTPSPTLTATALAERPASAATTLAQDRSPLPMRVDVGRETADRAVRARPPVPEPRPRLSPTLVGIPIVAGRSTGSSSGKAPAAGHATADACADERSAASTACADADVARDAARGVADRLRDAQRALADLQARVEEAGVLADPRRLAAEKDRLHAQFQTAHANAASADDAEAAARDWLTAVSAANTAAQDAARRAQSGTDEIRNQSAMLERLDL